MSMVVSVAMIMTMWVFRGHPTRRMRSTMRHFPLPPSLYNSQQQAIGVDRFTLYWMTPPRIRVEPQLERRRLSIQNGVNVLLASYSCG
jgi:hypothetical protein